MIAVLKPHRKLLAGMLAGIAIICTSATIVINADFKGEWTYNEKNSKVPEGRFRPASKIKVTQDADAINIERTNSGPNGDFTSAEKITFDGKTAESTGFGGSKRKSAAAWATGGNEMTINSTIVFERDGNTFEVKITEVWKLINDGKSLSIESTSVSQRGTVNQSLVYDKQ